MVQFLGLSGNSIVTELMEVPLTFLSPSPIIKTGMQFWACSGPVLSQSIERFPPLLALKHLFAALFTDATLCYVPFMKYFQSRRA